MSKSYTTEYPPLRLLKQVTAKYPSAWAKLDDFHNSNGKDNLPSWPDWCYAPMAASIAVVTNGAPKTMDNEEFFMDSVIETQQVAALAVWRRSKEVFVFDSDMEQLLTEQDAPLTIPSEILLQLPYPCFYIEMDGLFINGVQYHGFFTHLEYDINTNSPELRLLFLADDLHTFGYPIHLDVSDIESSIQKTLSEAGQNITDIQNGRLKKIAQQLFDTRNNSIDELYNFLRKALQAVLYVCAINADIEPNQEQKTITKRSTTGVIRDRYAEIRKWDVGVRIGSSVRHYKKFQQIKNTETARQGSHTSKRPHIRRGHWHHYWTGKKAEEEKRKLILKWTAPMYIGMNDDDDENSPAVIHNIRS